MEHIRDHFGLPGGPKIFHGAHCGSSWGDFGDRVAPSRSYFLRLPTTSNRVRTQALFWSHLGHMLFNPGPCWNYFKDIRKLPGLSWSHLRPHLNQVWRALCNFDESIRSSWSHLRSIVILICCQMFPVDHIYIHIYIYAFTFKQLYISFSFFLSLYI